jgi:hypothetical protein
MLGYAEAVLSKDAEIVLAVGQTLRGGFPVPFYRERIVGLIALSPALADGEIVHRRYVAFLRRRIPQARLATYPWRRPGRAHT